jgi:hypothetical protein
MPVDAGGIGEIVMDVDDYTVALISFYGRSRVYV